MIITKKFEVLGYAGLCWPSMAFLAFVALDDFLKQKLAFFDKNQAELTCFQQSDVKTNYQTRSGILKHCACGIGDPDLEESDVFFSAEENEDIDILDDNFVSENDNFNIDNRR